MRHDQEHETSVALWKNLMGARGVYQKRSNTNKIDRAVANVFDPKTHPDVKRYIARFAELGEVGSRMGCWGIDITTVYFPLDNVFDDEADSTYADHIARWQDLYQMRKEMATVGIPTNLIDQKIRIVFKPSSSAVDHCNEPTPKPDDAKRTSTSSKGASMTSTEGCVSTNDRILPKSRPHDAPKAIETSSSTNALSTLTRKRSGPNSSSSTSSSEQYQESLGLAASQVQKRRKVDVQPTAIELEGESFEVQIIFLSSGGIRLDTKDFRMGLSLRFDVELRHLVCYCGDESLSATLPCLSLDVNHVVRLIRPAWSTPTSFKVRFETVNSNEEEDIFDIEIPTKQECKVFLTKLKRTVLFEEITVLSPFSYGNKRKEISEEKRLTSTFYGDWSLAGRILQLDFQEPESVTANGNIFKFMAMVCAGEQELGEAEDSNSRKVLSVTLTEYRQVGRARRVRKLARGCGTRS